MMKRSKSSVNMKKSNKVAARRSIPKIDSTSVPFEKFLPLLLSSVGFNKDFVIRDLIFHAADSLDRYCAESWLKPRGIPYHSSLVIKLIIDKKNETLTITDNGPGMTRAEVINFMNDMVGVVIDRLNLANSGDFKLSSGAYSLGIFSMFFMAYKILVITKNDKDKQFTWESTACGKFLVKLHKKQLIERGTRLTLYLKKTCLDYLKRDKIRHIVKKYCKSCNYPIKLVYEKVAVTGTDDFTQIMEIGDVVTSAYGYKKKQVYIEDEQLNEVKPLWNLNSYDTPLQTYRDLYQSLYSDFDDFMAYQHFAIEGSVKLNCILFIPQMPPSNPFSKENNQKNLKLYSEGRFIMYNQGQMIPEYLNFIRGVVDCPEFPKRAKSVLQEEEQRLLQKISQALVRKVLEYLVELKENRKAYEQFFLLYSNYVKMCVMEDEYFREGFKGLLMFPTSKSYGRLMFFDDVLARMEDSSQDYFYYLCGDNTSNCLKSALIEYLRSIDYEIIFMVEPIDAYLALIIEHYFDVVLVSCGLEHVPIPMTRRRSWQHKRAMSKYKKLCQLIQDILDDHVTKVVVSQRLIDSPVCVVNEFDKCSPTMMELNAGLPIAPTKLMQKCTSSKTILEINPNSPIIQTIVSSKYYLKHKTWFNECVHVMFGLGRIISGYRTVHDLALYCGYIYNWIERALDLPTHDYTQKLQFPEISNVYYEEEEDELQLSESKSKEDIQEPYSRLAEAIGHPI